MSDEIPETRDIRAAEEIDAICSEFDSAWRSGKTPSIEDFLKRRDVSDVESLLPELLAVEIDYRRKAGQTPVAEDYTQRLAEHTDFVRNYFRVHVSTVQADDSTAVRDQHADDTGNGTDPERDRTDLRSGVVQRFGDYELLEKIAQGGMGVVYKARQTKLDRIVALKMIRSGTLASAEEVQRFQTEAEAAAQLDHPHIVPVYEVGERNGQHFFSMGYVEGRSLAGVLRDGPLPQKDAAELVKTIAEAVEYAHQRGIIHRDLKPGNVLIDEQGRPRVTDFGLAKRTQTDDSLTSTGQILGTPGYMPPEQARGDMERIGPLADVYSLGAVLYALLTGRPPFQAANVVETLKQVLDRAPISPRELNPSMDRDLETICLKCLEKEPAKRYGSADALSDDLGRYATGEPIAARPVGRIEQTRRWCKRHPARAGFAVVSVLALMALAGLGGVLRYQGELSDSLDREKDLSGQLSQKNTQLETANTKLDQTNKKLDSAFREEKKAKTEAEGARDAEKKAKNERDFVVYIRQVNLALAEWKDGQVTSARELLQSCPKKWRQWEWHYAYRTCHPELLTLKGHTQYVRSVAFSPDGKLIASGGDTTVRVWDAKTGRQIITLKGHTTPVESVAFSPDGKQIVSGASEKAVRVWDVKSGRQVRLLTGHTGPISSVAFSPDGKRIASGSLDGTFRVWDSETSRELLTLQGHKNVVKSVAFSPSSPLKNPSYCCWLRRARVSAVVLVRVEDSTGGKLSAGHGSSVAA